MGPTPLDTALTFIPVFSGFLSIVGATAILYNILSDHQRRFTSPYFRIMFGLSVADLIFGLVSMTSTFLDPKGNPWLYFARGNEASCKARAFIQHAFGFPQPIYIASLSIYYLFVIRYDMKDVVFRKKFEPWLHILAFGYPLLGSIVSLSLDLFASVPLGCRMKYSATVYNLVFSGSVIYATLSIIVICLVSIVLYVRKRERIMNRRFSFANSEISRSRGLVKQYKAVTTQAILYITSFILAWIFPGINLSLFQGKSPVPLILAAFFWPLQGFFNSIVYFWPRFVKSTEEHRDKSCCWIIKDMVLTTTIAKEQRRVQARAQRRRSSLMKPIAYNPITTYSAVAHAPLSISLVLPRNSPSRLQQSSPVIDSLLRQTSDNSNARLTEIALTEDLASGVEMTKIDNDLVISGSIEYEPLVRLRAELLAEHMQDDIDSGNPGNNNR